MEPTPRAGSTIPGKKIPKNVGQELTTQWERNVEWYEKQPTDQANGER